MAAITIRDRPRRSETRRRSALASWVRRPCLYEPLASPFGADAPRVPWKRHTVQPRTAGALHRFLVRFETAEHRGAFCTPVSWGWFRFPRRALPPIRYIADDSLPAIIHCNMLHTDGSSFAASLSSTTKPKWREPKKGARKTLKPPLCHQPPRLYGSVQRAALLVLSLGASVSFTRRWGNALLSSIPGL
jgi:hypothetical protein